MGQMIVKDLKEIRTIIEEKKFLLVRGSAYEYMKIKEIFDAIPHVEFSDFSSNPLYEQVCKGVEVFNKEHCDLIIAVGGGSTIDVAKCIKLYCKMDSSINYLKQEPLDSDIEIVAMPTTAGSGSESTCYAVIYYQGEKQTICHRSIIPEYAVLESSVLKTLPVYQKKCTLLDALCQAIESWWSVNSTSESIEFSRKAIEDIKGNWEDYIFYNTDSAAEKIMGAANNAGRAINITATTAAHAMSYKITSLYKIPHGHAVAICMLEVWEYLLEHMDECIDSRGVEYFKDTLAQMEEIMNLSYFKSMLKKMEMGYPTAVKRELEIEILAKSVNPVRLKNNPIVLNEEVLKEMYGRIVKV